MINLIYIHGLDSSPKLDKLAILERSCDSLHAPWLDYRKDSDVFGRLLRESQERDINFIVGSSAGGLMGYWLAKHLQCPALLFNPALNYHDPNIPQKIAKPPKGKGYFYSVVLGQLDTIIDPETTLDYLKSHESKDNYEYEVLETLGHTIDLEMFGYACLKYVESNPNREAF